MPTQNYTSFYKGISKDDYVALPWSYLYGRNIDGSIFWYGVTIARKSTKVIEVQHPIYDITALVTRNTARNLLVWHDWTNWYIYNIGSDDNTPEKIVTPWDTSCPLLVWAASLEWGYVFIWRSSSNYQVHNIHTAPDYVSLSLTYWTYAWGDFLSDSIPAYIVEKSLVMIGANDKVITVDNVPLVKLLKVVSWAVTTIASSWSVILLYTIDGKVYTWNGVGTSTTGSKSTGYKVVKSWGSGWEVYTTTEKWVLLRGNGVEFNELYRKRRTTKAEDNTSYYDIIDLSMPEADRTTWNSIQWIEWEIFFIEGQKRISKLSSPRSDMERGYHSTLDTDHAGRKIDKIYCIREVGWNLYFSYKSWVYYGVDFIDSDSLKSLSSAEMILPVFRGVPDEENKEARVKFTVSNTSGNKRVRLYKRIDQGAWELIRTINQTDSYIFREKISLTNKQFTEFQYKIEFENPDQDDRPPILHSISIDYNVINA